MHYICSLIGYLLHVNKLSSLYSIGIQYHNTLVLAKKKSVLCKKKKKKMFLSFCIVVINVEPQCHQTQV